MLGNQISLTNNVAKQVISVTATQNQTDFTVQGGYRINQLGVYRNGVRLVDGRDFLARNGSSVTLVSQGANAGDAMEFVVFDDFRVADALSVNTGGTVNASVNITGALQMGTGTSIFSPAENELTLGTNSSERVRVSAGGSVGIGTNRPITNLMILGRESRAGEGLVRIRNDHTTTGQPAWGLGITRQANGVRALLLGSDDNNNAAICVNGNNSLIFGEEVSGTWTEHMRINSAGNVGIGTDDPDNRLHVQNDGGDAILELQNSGNGNHSGIFFVRESSGGVNKGAANIRVESDTSSSGSALVFGCGNNITATGSEKMRIENSGNLGIGTGNPPARLSGIIESNVTKYLPPDYSENWAGAFINEVDGATYNGVLIANRWRGTESTVLKVGSLFNAEPDFDPYFTIDGVGKVGIGTDVPESNFHIVNSSGNNSTGPAKPGIHMGEGGTNDYHIHINSVTSDGNAYIDFSEPGVDYHSRIIKTMGGGFVFIQQENQVMQFRTNGTTRMQISGSGNVQVVGSLSKGSGSFKIDHPLVGMSTTHNLVHSFIEGPQADLIYRGKVDLVGGSATVNIDTAGRMTEGTFNALCTNVQCFTSNETDWTAVKGSVSGNVLTITAQENTSTATVSWMVVGERKDQHMIDTEWTDDNGRVITEPIKEIISDV